MALLVGMYNALACSLIYGWLVQPISQSLPDITFVNMYGAFLLLELIFANNKTKEDLDKVKESVGFIINMKFIVITISLIIASIMHFFF
jgi:hypothetical protein